MHKYTFLIVLTAYFAAGASASPLKPNATDCTLVVRPENKAWIGDPNELLHCFGMVPVNKTMANETINQLLNMVDMYAFTDLAFNSSANGAVYDLKVDLIDRLKNISADVNRNRTTTLRDFTFHRKISSLFTELRDAHTRYETPKGYTAYIMKPFSLKVAKNQKGEMSFFLADPGRIQSNTTRIADIFQIYAKFNVSEYIGKEVTSIHGTSTLQHLIRFSDNFVGLYKDQQVRMNALLRRGGFWQVINVPRYGMELRQYSKMFLPALNKTIDVPFLAVYGFEGPINISIIQERNQPTPLSPTKKRIEGVQTLREALDLRTANRPFDPHREIDEDLDRLDELIGARLPSEAIEKKRALLKVKSNTSHPPPLEILKRTANDTFVYMIVDKTYPVFKFSTFAPVDPSDSNLTGPTFTNFIQTVTEAFDDYRQRNSTVLMIDMSRNGGGLICLAYDLLASLIFEWSNYTKKYESVVWQPYDARRSLIMDAQIESPAGKESYSANYGHMETRKYWENDSWFNEAPEITRGGKSLYLKKSYFPFSCGNPKIPLLDQPGWPENKLPYLSRDLDKIMVLTDGTCGSACSLFLTKLQTYKKAHVVSYGGVLARWETEPMETSSFAGGNVLDWDEVIRELNTLNISSEMEGVSRLPTSAYTRFNHHETYPTKDSPLPREFMRIPADNHLYIWGAIWETSPIVDGEINSGLLELYRAAAQLFKLVVSGAPGEARLWEEKRAPSLFNSLWIYVVILAIGVLILTTIIIVIMQIRRNMRKAEKEAAKAHGVRDQEGYERVPTLDE